MTLLPLLMLAAIGDPVVIDPAATEARAVIVVVDGRAYQVQTTPFVPPGPGPSPRPDPQPTPTPQPEPPPAPQPPVTPVVSGPIHVWLVSDLDSPTPDTTDIRIGREIQPALAGMQATYRTRGIKSPDLDRLNLRPYLAGFKDARGRTWPKVDPPVLIVQAQSGEVLSVEASPLTEPGIIAKVAALRGKAGSKPDGR